MRPMKTTWPSGGMSAGSSASGISPSRVSNMASPYMFRSTESVPRGSRCAIFLSSKRHWLLPRCQNRHKDMFISLSNENAPMHVTLDTMVDTLEGGGRIQPLAHSGAAVARRPYRLRPHRNPQPVAAARLAPSQAAARSRADRPLPGRLLGIFPAGGRRCGARFRACGWSSGVHGGDPQVERDLERLAAVKRRRQDARRRIFLPTTPQAGTRSARCMCRTARSRRRCSSWSASGRSSRCSTSAPAPGGCSKSSRRSTGAASASTCRARCWRWRAPISTRPASRNAQVRQGDIFAPPVERDAFDLVTIHQVLHYLDDPALRHPRGGAAAAARRAGW